MEEPYFYYIDRFDPLLLQPQFSNYTQHSHLFVSVMMLMFFVLSSAISLVQPHQNSTEMAVASVSRCKLAFSDIVYFATF